MSKGKKALIWFWIIVILVVGIFLISNFRFVKKFAKTIFYQTKSALVITEINPEENKRELEKYKVYLESKDLNSIYVEWGSKGYESLNDEVSFEGKNFYLDDKIIVKINGEIKVDITQCFEAGDIVKIIYSPFSVYLFIERYETDCGCFISYKEKIDI